MMQTFKDIGIGLVAGVVLLTLGVNSIGILAAVAVPESLIEGGGVVLKHIIWDILVVQVIGIGILSAMISYLSVRFLSNSWLKTAIPMCMVVLGFTVMPGYFQYPASFLGNPWWAHAHEFVVIGFVLVFAFLAGREKTQ